MKQREKNITWEAKFAALPERIHSQMILLMTIADDFNLFSLCIWLKEQFLT